MSAPFMGQKDFWDSANSLRRNVEDIKTALRDLTQEIKQANDDSFGIDEDKGEMIANLTLSYRHLEDARMRLGKSIQASDGGTSVYDNDKEPQTAGEITGQVAQGPEETTDGDQS